MRPNLAVLRSAIGPMLTDAGQLGSLEWVVNPDTGIEEETFVARYTGPMLVRPEGVEVAAVGSATFPQQRFDVTLPAEVEPLIGDRVVLTASADPMLVNANLSLTDVALDSYVVARFCKAERQ